MKVVNHVIYYQSKTEKFLIVPFGDLHVGNRNADLRKIREIANWIRETPKCYWLGMGDYVDAIVWHPNEKRIDPDIVDYRYYKPEDAYEFIYRLFEPIKNKCLGLLTGNHDDILRKRHYKDWVKDLAQRLNVPYLTFSAFLRLSFRLQYNNERPKNQEFVIFATHGYYTGRSTGGKVTRLESLAQWIEADIYLMAHTHELLGHRRIVLAASRGGRVIEKKKVFALTGGFLRGYVNEHSYVEKRLLAPTKIGILSIEIEPWRRDIHVKE